MTVLAYDLTLHRASAMALGLHRRDDAQRKNMVGHSHWYSMPNAGFEEIGAAERSWTPVVHVDSARRQ